MKDWTSIRDRYLRDNLPVRLGGLAANLSRIKSCSIPVGPRQIQLVGSLTPFRRIPKTSTRHSTIPSTKNRTNPIPGSSLKNPILSILILIRIIGLMNMRNSYFLFRKGE